MYKKTTQNFSILYFLLELITANVGYYKHHSVLWTIFDAIFAPIVWLKWFIYQEVNVTLISDSFNWFLK